VPPPRQRSGARGCDEATAQDATVADELDIYLVRHTPAKWIGTVEAVDADAAIAEAVKLFDVEDPRKLIAVRRQ
jgi:hypothetical protein